MALLFVRWRRVATTDPRVERMIQLLEARPMALATMGPAAPVALAPPIALSTPQQRGDVVARLRGPSGVPRLAADYALALGLYVEAAPIPDSLPPAIVDGDRILYRPGPDSERAILGQVAAVALLRSGHQATAEDAQLLAVELSRPALVRHVLA